MKKNIWAIVFLTFSLIISSAAGCPRSSSMAETVIVRSAADACAHVARPAAITANTRFFNMWLLRSDQVRNDVIVGAASRRRMCQKSCPGCMTIGSFDGILQQIESAALQPQRQKGHPDGMPLIAWQCKD